MVGDSVLLGAHDTLVARLAGWTVTVSAREGFSTLAAPSIINANRPNVGEVAVVALGNNDAGNPVTFGQRRVQPDPSDPRRPRPGPETREPVTHGTAR